MKAVSDVRRRALATSLAAVALIFSSVAQAAPKTTTIWSGVYTDEQASRGKIVHDAGCSLCHGLRLDGANQGDMPQSPPIAGAPFLQKWAGRSLVGVFGLIRATMPQSNPGSLTDQQYIDALAYMLKVSGAPAGAHELTPSTADLAGVAIAPKP